MDQIRTGRFVAESAELHGLMPGGDACPQNQCRAAAHDEHYHVSGGSEMGSSR